MRKFVLFFMAVFGCCVCALAQNGKVSGTVTSADGKPIAGATVVIEGSHVGTSTNADGKYTLNVRPGDVLQVSFIGMQTQRIPVNGKTTVDVTMQDDAIGLDNVVITALGITRQERTLGYASTTIKADEIAKGHAADAMTGLIGKVAGMQISSSGGTGTSQKVIVRGYSSLAGSNQPLYVIDGVPVSNSTMGTQDLNNSIDFGNQAADVNPEDIESITVLKGASATALYGSRAGNGVIIITTKRGHQNEDVTVTYDGSFMASTALRIPQLQDKFGQGWYYDYDGGYFGNFSPTENGSWGNILDGRENYWRPGATWNNGAEMSYKPFSYAKNSLKNFYDTGFETNNTITVQGGTANSGFVASYGNTYSNGILPGNDDYFKRNTFSFRGNTKIKGGLAWLNYGVTYVRKDVRNAMTGQGQNGSTIYQDILQYPVDIDYGDLKDYNSIYNNADNYYSPYAQNPWWTLDHNYSTFQDDRVYGNIEVGFQLYKGLSLIGRLGGDFSNSLEKYYNDIWVFSPGSYTETEGGSAEQGSYEEISRKSNQIDANVLLNADYRFGRDWSLHAAAGWNLNQRTASYLDGSLTGLAVENWPSFGNTSGATPTSASLYQRRRLIGLYGQADLGWRDGIYLTLSARNDWSSTLPIDSNSFFYWGVNASVVLTDLFPSMRSDVLSFLKLRGGYGKTGNDASPYYTSGYYVLGSATGGFGDLTFPLNGYSGLLRSTRMPASDLKPEISTEWEIGADVRLFQNRINLDVAYYNKETKNQIISATLAPEAGYTTRVRNVGKIQNRGVELTLGLVPVRTKDWEWNFTYTFSKNNNEVKELWDDVTETTIYGLTSGPQPESDRRRVARHLDLLQDRDRAGRIEPPLRQDDRQRHERLSGRLHHRDGDHRPCRSQIHDGLQQHRPLERPFAGILVRLALRRQDVFRDQERHLLQRQCGRDHVQHARSVRRAQCRIYGIGRRVPRKQHPGHRLLQHELLLVFEHQQRALPRRSDRQNLSETPRSEPHLPPAPQMVRRREMAVGHRHIVRGTQPADVDAVAGAGRSRHDQLWQ